MYLPILNKIWQLSLLGIIGISSSLAAQNYSNTFSFQHWDSLYTNAVNHQQDSVESIVQQLLHLVETIDDDHGTSYSKFVLANEFFRRGALEKAFDYNEQAIQMCSDLQGAPVDEGCHKIMERIYFLGAKLHQAKGNLNQAIFNYERAAELGEADFDENTLLYHIGLGEIYLNKGDYLEAYQYFGLARQLAIEHKIGNKMSAMVLRESAELMSEVGLDSLSEKNLSEALQIAIEYSDTTLIIKTLCARGQNHFKANRIDQAETAFSEALSLSKQKNALDLNARAQIGLGKIAYKRGDAEGSLLRFEEVSQLAEILNERNILAESHTYIGMINLDKGLVDSALFHCDLAFNTSSEVNLLRIQLQSCNCLKQVYERRQEWRAAFEIQREENDLKTLMNEDQLLQKISSIRFEQSMTNLKDEQARERLRLESEKSWSDQLLALQSNRVILLSILFGTSLLLAFILYLLFKGKKSHNRDLQLLNQQLNTTNHLLEDSNNDLNISNESLQQTNQALNNFAAVAAHDLKGPLRTINSFTQLLKRKLGDKVGQNEEEYFQYIKGSSEKLSTLIDDLLNFSRLGKQMIAPSKVNLNQVFNDVKINLHQSIEESNAQVSSNSLPDVSANTSLMTQLFQNIISNSIKFAKESQAAAVSISSTPFKSNRVQISIKDNGIGIPDHLQEQVFELFARLNSKEKYEGSGVGLATCRKIVQHYGGKMKINSREGVGTTVIFDLPLEVH